MPDNLEAKARISDDERKDNRQADTERNADPGRHSEIIPQQRRHIGADSHKRAMAERDEAKAPHNRP
jgi:hypothetical protein